MVEIYISLIMIMLICFGSGIEFAKYIFKKNKRYVYESLKAYFEIKEG